MSNEVGLCLTLFFSLQLLTTVQATVSCTRALDVVIVQDCGPDVSDDDWNRMQTLSQGLISYLQPSTNGSHVAQVQFGGNTTVVQGLGSESVITDRSRSLQPGRNLSDAIDTTRRLVLNNADGDRPEVPDVIVLITFGVCDDKDGAIAEATRAKLDGIRIVTLGVTNTDIDELREELREIATDPDDDSLILIVNRREYHVSVMIYPLAEVVCGNTVNDSNESIRLVDRTSHSGRLEVYVQGEWVTVCSNGWTELNTGIACKQLGFLAGLSMSTMNQTHYHRRIGIANIQCTGYETNLLRCPHDPFFRIDSSCDHQRDVFLRCLCDDCDDYTRRDNIQLTDKTPISGRLEVLRLGIGWGGVCSNGWIQSNTDVACRQLGFLRGTKAHHGHPVTFALYNVICSGNENSLFNCTYSITPTQNCIGSVYILCECTQCHELLLQAPQQKEATTGSTEVFKWRFKHNISAFDGEIAFLSQKNPQILIYIREGKVVEENTRFKDRIQFTHDDYATVGFKLTSITTADMGIYVLYAKKQRLTSKAILIVKDFAEVPDPLVYCQVHDGIRLSWDLRALRKLGLRDITVDILLTSPATGRLHLDYYYTEWLPDNPHRHSVPQPPDYLHPTIIVNDVTVSDAGIYVIELTMTSSVYQWLNSSWQFVTKLVVVDTDYTTSSHVNQSFLVSTVDIDHGNLTQISNNVTKHSPAFPSNYTSLIVSVTVLGALLALAIFIIIKLRVAKRRRERNIERADDRQQGRSTGTLSIPLPPLRAHRQQGGRRNGRDGATTHQGPDTGPRSPDILPNHPPESSTAPGRSAAMRQPGRNGPDRHPQSPSTGPVNTVSRDISSQNNENT